MAETYKERDVTRNLLGSYALHGLQASFHTKADSLVGPLLQMSSLMHHSRPVFAGAMLGFAACIMIPALFSLWLLPPIILGGG